MSLVKREGELKRIPVIVLGAGGVGAALLRQIMGSRQRVQQRNEVVFEVVAVADSRSCWCQATNHGLGNGQLMDIVNAKKEGLPVDPAAILKAAKRSVFIFFSFSDRCLELPR